MRWRWKRRKVCVTGRRVCGAGSCSPGGGRASARHAAKPGGPRTPHPTSPHALRPGHAALRGQTRKDGAPSGDGTTRHVVTSRRARVR
eukprot:3818333-Prymnesium_polylepis.1